ncbi:lytic transglycosylase domain-containing protein [Siminovitchia fortis]|nr:lytic transglycosylase domain-containing protein [Siminovitchia fortis]WHY83162.1 lytic transglycosylase domain-containing protein [Siminovitchia fortis]
MNKISKKRPAVQSKPSKRKRRVLLMLILPFAAFMLLLTYLDKQNIEKQDPQPNEEVPSEFMPIYKAAEMEYGVPWYLLAAHHRVETIFSTMDPMISPVGAEGHMQFMPCTFVGWSHPSCDGLGTGDIPEDEKTDPAVIKKYGGYGVDANGDGKADPWDIEDSIFTAANYLAKNGAAAGDFEKAVFAYNHSNEYVEEVLYYAEKYQRK